MTGGWARCRAPRPMSWRGRSRACSQLDDLSFESLDGAIVSTVVPQLGPEYEHLTERYLGRACLLVGPTLKTGMPILVDNPHELGADRLVNAVAAHAKVDGACVAVDFGTSTNFDVVSGAGEYLGGVIGPGVEISLEALTSRTAKLPRIDLSAPEGPIGKHTQAAIQAGFTYGFAGARRRHRPAPRRGARRARDLHRDRRPRGDDRSALRDDRRGRPAAHPAGPSPDQSSATPRPCSRPSTSPFRIGDVEISNRVLLAPLAGIGNWFVRLQARRHGAGLAVSEMVSSFGLTLPQRAHSAGPAPGSTRTSIRSRSSCSDRTPR